VQLAVCLPDSLAIRLGVIELPGNERHRHGWVSFDGCLQDDTEC
jgi:hypothetical protein